MPKSLALKSTVDDALKQVAITDFKGMLDSESDLIDLSLDSWTDCGNVRLEQGKAIGRDGYIKRATLSAIADGIKVFYDSTGTRKGAIWIGGNLYELNLSTYATTLVHSSLYTAGRRISCDVLNKVLYFTDGDTIVTDGADKSGVMYWNPATAASGIVVSSGLPVTIKTPAARALCVYNGQLVLGGLKYVDGTYALDTVIWSNVLDPTNVIGTNIFAVGNGQGGAINSLVPFRIGSEGISPYGALFVGKELSTHQLVGALTPSTLVETTITAQVGVLDGMTVVSVPNIGSNRTVQILWLASDRQVWATDGIDATPLTLKIKTELYNWISDRFAANSGQEFFAYLDTALGHYVLDAGGGRHYCYDYRNKGWTKYKGWPNGMFCTAKDASSRDIVFMVNRSTAELNQVNVGTNDNGSAINPFIVTAAIHAGDPTEDKTWHWAYAFWSTDTSQIKITATNRLGRGDYSAVTMSPAALAPGTFSRFDSAIFDTDIFAIGETVGYVPMQAKARLVVLPTTGSRYLLKGSSVQLRIEQPTDSSGRFELLAVFLFYLPGGHTRHAPIA